MLLPSRLRLISLLAFAVFACQAKVFDKSTTIAGLTVYVKVVLPNDYDPAKPYPAVLAFPPGGQGMDMVMVTLQQNWAAEAQRRKYIVVIPAAPGGHSFTADGAKVFPEFLDYLLSEYKIRDNKFFVAGMSNGGLSAFSIAAAYPQYFWSVTGFPGYLRDASPERVNALAKLCINMYVGGDDTQWLIAMKEQEGDFRQRGFNVQLSVEAGQGHVMSTLMGERAGRLFQDMERARKGCTK